MADYSKYLDRIEQDKLIVKTLDQLHKELNVIYTTGDFGSLRAQASAVLTDVLKLRKGLSRMKGETAEKRLAKLVDLAAQLKSEFLAANQAKKEAEYLALLAAQEAESKKEAEINSEEQSESQSSKKVVEIKKTVVSRGGKRAGAGRKSLGTKKAVSIALEQHEWDEIDNLIQKGGFKGYSDYFRWLHRNSGSNA